MSRHVEFFLYPYVVMFQSLPKVALAPLIVVWFGLGLSSKVINAALVAFFPLLVNTMVGLRSADEERVSLMRSLAASDWQIFWMLRAKGLDETTITRSVSRYEAKCGAPQRPTCSAIASSVSTVSRRR